MPNTSHHGGRCGRSAVVIVVAIVVAAAAGIGLFVALRRNAEAPPEKIVERPPVVETLSKDECLHLVELRNQGIAYLENERFADAGRALAELTSRLPDDPVGSQNLLITMILSRATTTPVSGDAESLIGRLKQQRPESFVPHVLAARWAKATKNETQTITELSRAVELADGDLPTMYEFYEETNASRDPALQEKGRAVLRQAREKHPDNLYVLSEWLPVQAGLRDSAIVDSVQAARGMIRPVLETVAAGPQLGAPEFLEKALDAASRDDWRQVSQFVAVFRNVIRPTPWVQSDLRRTQRHALAFVVHEFSRLECIETELREPLTVPIGVTLARAPDERQPPAMPSVKAVRFADFDLDGRTDLFALAEGKLTVLGRKPDEPWSVLAETDVPAPMSGLIVADLDRDQQDGKPASAAVQAGAPKPADELQKQTADSIGPCQDADVDLVAFGPVGIRVFRNDLLEDGARRLTPIEQETAFGAIREVLAAQFGDFDHDGDLDLMVSAAGGITVWLNRGDLRFYDATSRSTLPPPALRATSLVAVDWNRDFFLDVVVSGSGNEPGGFLENLGHGQFRWRPFSGPLAELQGSESIALLDQTGNGSWDVVGTGSDNTQIVTTKTDGGTVEGTSATPISELGGRRLLLFDLDNNSSLDVLSWSDANFGLYRGTTSGRFIMSNELFAPPPQGIIDGDAADIDGDGDIDLAFATNEGVVLYMNEGGNRNHWLDVRVRAKPDHTSGRVNHLGIGSVVEIKAGPFYRAQVVTGQVTHFGLGAREAVDAVRILWTNGVPQNAFPKQTDAVVCEEQFPTGSCPFLYTWTGEKFEFFTDLLWNAPLGLQLAEGVVARPREWEYLLIPGERMVPRDGRYVLQITEELWEAGYFDRMQLIAVDHPAEVDVYSNEKVGPAEIAPFRVHTVRQPRAPVVARDAAGRDVLDRISRRDGVYMKGFPGETKRGYVGEHFLELDLGRLDNSRQVTLFLTGWLYPTPTSVNVGISQNADFGQPRPPALWAPDAQGEWKEIRPFMGFPGGKPKTIAVDLTGAFSAGDYRLRIVTSQEFYWDEAFFTVDDEPAPTKLIRMDPIAADLHYRGYSARRPVPDFGPDHYDYADVSTLPAWKAMSGRFTRFGDVAALLAAEDDRLVVLGAGDEMTVEFAVPEEAPPSGWKRDFLLYNVGWDKDADLNVITGQSSEPLPFRGMSGYPFRGDEPRPDTAAYRDYLQTYQTREQSPRGFWSQLRNPLPASAATPE